MVRNLLLRFTILLRTSRLQRWLPNPHDLLDILAQKPPRALPMLRATSSLLAAYLDKTIEQLLLDAINDSRDGFRPYLESRKYKENSVHTYVNHTKILLANARVGLEAYTIGPRRMANVVALATRRNVAILPGTLPVSGRHLERSKPRISTIGSKGKSRKASRLVGPGPNTMENSSRFRLRSEAQVRLLGQEKFEKSALEQLPLPLQQEVLEVLRWKKAEFAIGRPKGGQHREVSSKSLQNLMSRCTASPLMFEANQASLR